MAQAVRRKEEGPFWSVPAWMEGYHIDGFRFESGGHDRLGYGRPSSPLRRADHPDVVLIAEPGARSTTRPDFHARLAPDDHFRETASRGESGETAELHFRPLPGRLQREAVKRYIRGTPRARGSFRQSSHAVNYLGSHDDHAYGDFVRIGSGAVRPDQVISDPMANARLTTEELKISKLGALILFTSQGAVMMEEGHEFARSKVIARSEAPDND